MGGPLLIPLLALAGKGLMASAVIAGAGSMFKWSTDNMKQTGIISEDGARRLELGWAEHSQQERYLDMREDELEIEQLRYNQEMVQGKLESQYDMFSTMMIQELDQRRLESDIELGHARIQSNVDLFQMGQQKELEERNLYLQNLAFQTTNNILSQYGEEIDINKLSFMISELRKMNEVHKQPPPFDDTVEKETIPEEEFDYSRGDDLPPEAW